MSVRWKHLLLLAVMILLLSAAVGVADARALTFAPGAAYATGGGPRGVVVADFDHDGSRDLAVADWYGGTVSVLLGDGAGGLGPSVDYATGANPVSVAAGDLNDDGDPDLVVANYSSNTVSVLLGDGSGGFSAPVDFATGGAPNEVAVGDLTGDGDLDIAVADYNDSTVSILIGDGAGGFATRTAYATGGHPASIAVGDLNGDGHLDLVTSNEGVPGGASILTGDGSGAFPSHTDYTIGGIPRGHIAIGDLNGDGHRDIAIACADSDGVSLLFGDGTGAFTVAGPYSTGSHPTSVVAGDFQGDGVLDLAAANYYGNNVGVLMNDGDGGFAAPMELDAGWSTREVAAGDFNNDGLLDLVASNMGSGNVEVFLQSGCRITASANAGGSVSPGTRLFSSGATPTYTFTPISGYHLAEVDVDGSRIELADPNAYTFPALDADHVLSAAFAPNDDNAPSASVSGWKAGWQRWPVRLTFHGRPGPYGVAVAGTQFRLNGGVWQDSATAVIKRPGVTRVEYRAVDVNGVVGAAGVRVVKLDTGRPQVLARAASGRTRAALWVRFCVRDPRPTCGTALMRLVVVSHGRRALARASVLRARVNRWHAVRVSTMGLAPGRYLVVLRAMDAAGNFQRSVTHTTITVR